MKILVVTRMWPTENRPHSNPHLREQVQALISAGVECDVLVPPTNGRALPYIWLAGALNHRIRRKQYDLVHAHYGFAGIPARLQWRLPVVVTFHGNDLLPRPNAHGSPSLFGQFEQELSRALSGYVDRAVVVSPEMAQRIPHAHPEVIPVGVNLKTFRPIDTEKARKTLGLSPSVRYVLFVGNPDLPVKRHRLAVAAVDHLRRGRSDIELLTVADRPHEELPLWMNAADILLVTSLTEGSPVAVKEALACNLPIVSVPVGDIAERLMGVVPSAVVSASPEALAEALDAILKTGDRSNGRDMVRCLSTVALAKQQVRVYREILGERG